MRRAVFSGLDEVDDGAVPETSSPAGLGIALAGLAPFGVLRLDGKAASNLPQFGLLAINVKLPSQGRKGCLAGRDQGQVARAAILDNGVFVLVARTAKLIQAFKPDGRHHVALRPDL